MLVKPGVQLNGVHYMLWYAAAIWDYILTNNGLPQGTITGGIEGADPVGPARVSGTKHPWGFALDFRTRDLPSHLLPDLAQLLRRTLGPAFDVVLESDHIHVELAGALQGA